MVGNTQRTVAHSAADGDNLNIRIVVANVVSDLLQTAKGREIPYRVSEDSPALKCYTRGEASHILLRNAGVKKLQRELSFKLR